MWQRFTEQARKVIFFAQEEARNVGENKVLSGHLLLGLLREPDSVAMSILSTLGVDTKRIAAEVRDYVTQGEGPVTGDLTLAPGAKRVIDCAYEEARQLSHDYIGTEHLLLGLIQDLEGIAGLILTNVAKLDPERVRQEVRLLQGDLGDDGKPALLAESTASDASPVPPTQTLSWQRFTEKARQVIFSAQEEAQKQGEYYVSTEHLLLGLICDTSNVAVRILNRLAIPVAKIRREIERQVSQGDGRLGQDMQLTPRAKRVIEHAHDEARLLRNDYLSTEHLLLGLLHEEHGLGGSVLLKLGADLERVREEVRQLQAGNSMSDEKLREDTAAKTLPETVVAPAQPDVIPVQAIAVPEMPAEMRNLYDHVMNAVAQVFADSAPLAKPEPIASNDMVLYEPSIVTMATAMIEDASREASRTMQMECSYGKIYVSHLSEDEWVDDYILPGHLFEPLAAYYKQLPNFTRPALGYVETRQVTLVADQVPYSFQVKHEVDPEGERIILIADDKFASEQTKWAA